MLTPLQLQSFLFDPPPDRRALMQYQAQSPITHKIAICRNHAFELVEKTLPAYLDFAGIGARFVYSDYDDSLSFLSLDKTADLVVIWVDASRYVTADLQIFLSERIGALRDIYKGPVLLAVLGADGLAAPDGVVMDDLSVYRDRLGASFLDLRMEKFAGTKLSAAACQDVSRFWGLVTIPSLLRPALKGIVVDLDQTLYRGVLGEDGPAALVLTDAHRRLQEHLADLGRAGFFLAIASKNDPADVAALFEQRQDFPLRPAHFTKICASWNPKSESIAAIAAYLNIGVDSLLFVDDNGGELAAACDAHPHVHVLQAHNDAAITLDVLRHYPGLVKRAALAEDGLRQSDVMANEQRRALQTGLSRQAYLASLAMRVVFSVNAVAHKARIAELAGKTNQFIFSYRRYSQQQIADLMADDSAVIVDASLSDKLSDSGLIGAVVVKKQGDVGILDDAFVSCRALGRGIDDTLVLGMMDVALRHLGVTRLQIALTQGDRNEPALRFAATYLQSYRDAPAAWQEPVLDPAVQIGFEGNQHG